MASQKTLYGIIAVLIAIVVIVSGVAALYYYQYNQAESSNQSYISQLKALNVKYETSFFFDFGNGTNVWKNSTSIQPGWNAYVATQVITNGNLNATYYGPPLSEHFVTAIYNVENNDTQNTYWFFWTYNSTALWQTASVGPDLITVKNDSVFAWTYCSMNATTYAPDCTP